MLNPKLRRVFDRLLLVPALVLVIGPQDDFERLGLPQPDYKGVIPSHAEFTAKQYADSVHADKVASEEGAGGGCFVATAAYGDYDSKEVRVLRRFRDETLAHSGPGLAFIRFYYEHSPPVAAVIAESPWARSASRLALAPLVLGAQLHLETPWAMPLGLLLVLFLMRRRSRGRQPVPTGHDA